MGTPTRKAARRTGIALALVAAVSACAQGHDVGAGPSGSALPPVHVVREMLGTGSLVLPIEPYLFTDRQVGRLFRARAVLTASCMRRFGHSWPAPTATAPATGTLNPANTAHRYGITDAGTAARYGYHPAPGTTSGQSGAKNPERRPEPAELRVLTGLTADGTPAATDERGRPLPAGGCEGEATAALSGDPQKIGNRELVSTINIGSYRDSQRDPRVVSVFRKWSRCMRRHGYRYSDPTQTPGKNAEFTGPTVTRAETALAGADVACKRETNVVGVWSSVDAAYQRRAMDTKRRELAAVKRDMRRQLTNADRVLRQD
ncbi:hypothetical protein [Streptomyces sp. NPDC005423]|uniref:hypothetical protein n=1 Tax=Streptomyces sp. NPDC005423 TaxID=3155343 RepID=UPI0033A7CB72